MTNPTETPDWVNSVKTVPTRERVRNGIFTLTPDTIFGPELNVSQYTGILVYLEPTMNNSGDYVSADMVFTNTDAINLHTGCTVGSKKDPTLQEQIVVFSSPCEGNTFKVTVNPGDPFVSLRCFIWGITSPVPTPRRLNCRSTSPGEILIEDHVNSITAGGGRLAYHGPVDRAVNVALVAGASSGRLECQVPIPSVDGTQVWQTFWRQNIDATGLIILNNLSIPHTVARWLVTNTTTNPATPRLLLTDAS